MPQFLTQWTNKEILSCLNVVYFIIQFDVLKLNSELIELSQNNDMRKTRDWLEYNICF